MTELEIKKFARIKTMMATAILLIILTILLLIGETKGDIANGILFFIEAIINVHVLVMLTLLFGLTYFFGGFAGKEIITEKQNALLISLKYVILISLTISIYALIVAFCREGSFTYDWFEKTISVYFLRLFLNIDISLLVVWLWATNKMKLKRI